MNETLSQELTVAYLENYQGHCILDLLKDRGVFSGENYPLTIEEVKEFDYNIVKGNIESSKKENYISTIISKALSRVN